MSDAVSYRIMEPDDVAGVSALILASFDEFIRPEYTQLGIDEFRRFVEPAAIVQRTEADHFVLVAVAGDAPVGMIEIRQHNHVALLFVDKRYQHHGVGTELLGRAMAEARAHNADLARVTVNSSRYGVPAYEKLGFRQTGPEREVKGIRFIPMAKQLDD